MNSRDANARLYVSGFPPKTPKSEIHELCSRFGKVVSVDIIPGRRFGFVTFASHDDATLAVYGLNQEILRGIHHLAADWAKMKREDEKKEKNEDGQQQVQQPKQVGGGQVGGGGENGKTANSGPRYIPGSDADQPSKVAAPAVNRPVKTNGSAKPKTAPPEPAPTNTQESIPTSPTYTDDYPNLEITIHDTVSHEIKYNFRVKSLSALKQFLISEGDNIDPSQLLLSTAPQKDKNHISYSGLPVVHVYADSLGMEVLEPRDNKNQREKNIQNIRKMKGYRVPAAQVPLREARLPVKDLQNLLTQKGYHKVFLNLDSANGPLAPLHPAWRPVPYSHGYRKGNAIVYFVETGSFVTSCELFHPTNNTYKDLLPVLLKHDVCIFNIAKQAFIAPEQLQ